MPTPLMLAPMLENRTSTATQRKDAPAGMGRTTVTTQG